jgi:hypothetical protein
MHFDFIRSNVNAFDSVSGSDALTVKKNRWHCRLGRSPFVSPERAGILLSDASAAVHPASTDYVEWRDYAILGQLDPQAQNLNHWRDV